MSIVVRRWPSFGLQVAIGLGAGIVLGLLAREGGTPGTPSSLGVGLQTVGSIFVQLLKLMLPLLVFGTIVASVAALCELTDAARLAWRTLASFAITSRIAVAIGIGLGGLIEPGLRSTVSAAAAAPPPPRRRRQLARLPQGIDPRELPRPLGVDKARRWRRDNGAVVQAA